MKIEFRWFLVHINALANQQLHSTFHVALHGCVKEQRAALSKAVGFVLVVGCAALLLRRVVLEQLEVRLELGFFARTQQAQHVIGVDGFLNFFRQLQVRVLLHEHPLHVVVLVSVNVDRRVINEEVDELVLVLKLRLNSKERVERRSRLLVRHIRVAAVADQNFYAVSDFPVILVRQQIDEDVKAILVAVLHVYFPRIIKLQENSQVLRAQRVHRVVDRVTAAEVFLKLKN